MGLVKRVLVIAALVASAAAAEAQDTMKVVTPETLTWRQHPLFKEAQIAILFGDPRKAEMVVQRVKFPPNFIIPPHTHPYTEFNTVISGSAGWGMGETFDRAKAELLKPGGLMANPPKHPHFVVFGNEETIVQIQFMGPGGIDFVNPADDPRKK
jgi:quercetin dioxygenase-like cupin family protein